MNVVEGTEGMGNREGGNRKVDVIGKNGTGRDVRHSGGERKGTAGHRGREHFKAEGNISFLKQFPSSALGGALP